MPSCEYRTWISALVWVIFVEVAVVRAEETSLMEWSRPTLIGLVDAGRVQGGLIGAPIENEGNISKRTTS